MHGDVVSCSEQDGGRVGFCTQSADPRAQGTRRPPESVLLSWVRDNPALMGTAETQGQDTQPGVKGRGAGHADIFKNKSS